MGYGDLQQHADVETMARLLRMTRPGLAGAGMAAALAAMTLLPAGSANDQKINLPLLVVQAETVCVMIDPTTGVAPENPTANRKAQDDVERALLRWGRYRLISEPGMADLVILIRTGNGKIVNETVGGIDTNDRPVIVQPTDTGIRLGGKRGQTPGDPGPAPQQTNPTPQTEIGLPKEDSFVVYEGKTAVERDTSIDLAGRQPLWRYTAKKCLKGPEVPAVTEFKKAVDEAEKQLRQKQAQQTQGAAKQGSQPSASQPQKP